MLIADMGAGREHLSWAGGTLAHVDLLLVVVNPTVKSLTTAVHIERLARDLGIPQVGVVANRVSDGDGEQVAGSCERHGLEVLAHLPEDPEVRRAERDGVCILDRTPDRPIIDAVARLIDRIGDGRTWTRSASGRRGA